MNTLFDRRRAERFAQLLDEANGGRRHHSRSRIDTQLAELVTVGHQLGTMPLAGEPDTTFKRDLRAMLIATAEREGIGVTARTDTDDLRSGSRAAGRPALATGRARARGAIVVGIAAGTLALSGVSVASGQAMPGDALYGVKRSTEKAQLAMAGSDLSRGQLYLEFARTRLQEAHSVRSDELGFDASMGDMDGDTTMGVKLLTTNAADRRDTAALDVIDRFVADQRMLVAQLLDLVNPGSRTQVTESLALLDTIEKRSVALRTALSCAAKITGNDRLGPVAGACSTNRVVEQPTVIPPTPEATRKPAAVPAAGAPQASTAPQASASPSASPSPTGPAGDGTESESEGGVLDQLGRILGGILG